MTHAAQHGWATAETVVLLAVSAFADGRVRRHRDALAGTVAAVADLPAADAWPRRTWQGSSSAPRCFRSSSCSRCTCSRYSRYSALQTGIAYLALTLTVVVFAGVAQALATRFGIRWVMTVGLTLAAVSIVLYARLPVGGHYFWDLFPVFILSGVGLALSFVPMTIGALAGVKQADAGIASGLINTSQQVGGSIGVALATTIATTYTARYVAAHTGVTASRQRPSCTASRPRSTCSPRSRRSRRSSRRSCSSRNRPTNRFPNSPPRRPPHSVPGAPARGRAIPASRGRHVPIGQDHELVAEPRRSTSAIDVSNMSSRLGVR